MGKCWTIVHTIITETDRQKDRQAGRQAGRNTEANSESMFPNGKAAGRDNRSQKVFASKCNVSA